MSLIKLSILIFVTVTATAIFCIHVGFSLKSCDFFGRGEKTEKHRHDGQSDLRCSAKLKTGAKAMARWEFGRTKPLAYLGKYIIRKYTDVDNDVGKSSETRFKSDTGMTQPKSFNMGVKSVVRTMTISRYTEYIKEPKTRKCPFPYGILKLTTKYRWKPFIEGESYSKAEMLSRRSHDWMLSKPIQEFFGRVNHKKTSSFLVSPHHRTAFKKMILDAGSSCQTEDEENIYKNNYCNRKY